MFQRKKIGGIERIITQKFPGATVKIVGARTRDDVGGRTGAVPKLRAGIVRQDPEFSDRVDRGLENEAAINAVEVICAVDQKIIGLRPLAINRVTLTSAKRPSGFAQTRSERHNARLKQSQLCKVAPIER